MLILRLSVSTKFWGVGVELPGWVKEIRPWQRVAVAKILDAFQYNDVVVLDAPTGSGKTLIAEIVRQRLQARAVYMCTNIQLQEQFVADFPYGVQLMGRSNFRPELYQSLPDGWDAATCADCTKPECNMCSSVAECPYERAKRAALGSRLAVLNTAYFLTEANGPGRFSGRSLAIVDEADMLEKGLMDYAGIDISAGLARRYQIAPPEKVTVADCWREWFPGTIRHLQTKRTVLRGKDLRSERERSRLTRLIGKLKWIQPQIETGWTYTGKDGRISFKPITVDGLAPSLLWQHGRKWLLMSATVISPGQLLQELGMTGGYGAVSVPSSFPVKNRRVKVIPAADVTRKNGQESVRSLARALEPIIRRHAHERMLLHCVSYNLADSLLRELDGCCREVGVQCASYRNADEKVAAVAQFTEGDERGYLLVAPSMDRGVDLPDDRCRVVIIAKVPYPYLGDRQVSARIHSPGGQVWYNVQTVRSIVQMTGRAVRHEDDYCTTYILDSQFGQLWGRARGLFPKWWTDALEWSKV